MSMIHENIVGGMVFILRYWLFHPTIPTFVHLIYLTLSLHAIDVLNERL